MIFLDNAATTLQKPRSVSNAALQAMRTAASPGRGSYRAADRGAEINFQCRELAASLFGVSNPERVALTTSATHGLNIAIRSLVKPGSTVVVSGYEHNAVTRTLHAIPKVTVRIAETPLFDPQAMIEAYHSLLSGADVAVVNHVSNVFGYILPLEEIASLCRSYGIPLIVDASQSAGTLPLRFDALGAAYAAMPGHKGLYGPQGTGLLLCGEGMEPKPLIYGGTGSQSILQEMPEFLPDRLEAGTHNVPGYAGLVAGMRFVQEQGVERILRHEQLLRQDCARRLKALPGLEVFESPEGKYQAGVLSFRVAGKSAEEVGEALGQRGIAVRAGYHCAPFAHKSAGTLETGTIRASFSVFNSVQDGRILAAALARQTESGNM